MESHGVADSIQINTTTYGLIKSKFDSEHKGNIQVEGKGQISIWKVENRVSVDCKWCNPGLDLSSL